MNIHHRPSRLSPRRACAAVLALVALATLVLAAPARAQGVRLSGLHGERLGDGELSQGTTILVFWASWSPRSRDIVARVNPIAQRWGGRARVITVNYQEDAGTVQGFLAGKDLAVPVFLDVDGALSKKYAVATLPGLLILKDGNVAFRGKLPDDPDKVIVEILG